MPENEEGQELAPEGDKIEEQIDAELKAEHDRMMAEAEGGGEEDDKADKSEKDDGAQKAAAISDEEADKIALDYAKARGWDVKLPGEAEAEKAGAKEDAKAETAIDILEGLSDAEVPQAVLDEIDARFPGEHNARIRELLYIRASVREQIRQEAASIAKKEIAPIQQERQTAMWEATAQATAKDIADKAGVPEATDMVAKIIREAGPESEQLYKTDPRFKAGMDAQIKLAVMEVAASLEEQEEKPLPTGVEGTGGASVKGAGVSADQLTGEARAFAEGVRADVAKGLMTKAEGDAIIRQLSGAKQ